MKDFFSSRQKPIVALKSVASIADALHISEGKDLPRVTIKAMARLALRNHARVLNLRARMVQARTILRIGRRK